MANIALHGVAGGAGLATKLTSSGWLRLFLDHIESSGLELPSSPSYMTPSQDACQNPACGVCRSTIMTMRTGTIYVAVEEITENAALSLTSSCLRICPFLTILNASSLRNMARAFIQQCQRCRVGGIPDIVYQTVCNSDNMLVCFILALISISKARGPLPGRICQIPGSGFWTAAMFMLQRVSAIDKSNPAVLQGNIMSVIIYILLNDSRMARETMEYLTSARLSQLHRWQAWQISNNGQGESTGGNIWTLYTWSLLESDLVSTFHQTLIWPSVEDGMTLIDQNPLLGYFVCVVKHIDMILASAASPSHDDNFNNVPQYLEAMWALRANLSEELKWNDSDPPSTDPLKVTLQFNFYQALICISFPLLQYRLHASQSVHQSPKMQQPMWNNLWYCINAAKRLMNIDNNVQYRLPLNDLKRRWRVIFQLM